MGSKGKNSESTAKDIAEQGMVQLAEQLGWFLGTLRSKADHLLDNEAVKQQVSQIRDGAMELFDRVNKASAVAMESAKAARIQAGKPAKKSVAKAVAKPVANPLRQGYGGQASRSGGTVDAPGKRHRKAPPQESINKRMGEKVGKKAGQKQFKVGKSRGRG